MQTIALNALIREFQSRSPRRRHANEISQLLRAIGELGPLAIERPAPEGRYTRTCLHQCDAFEIAVLDWAPGSVAQVHDHGGESCWFVLLDGTLQVDDYRRLDAGDVPGLARVEQVGAQTLHRSDVDVRIESVAVSDLHRVEAAATTGAQSLHVYANPIREYYRYDAGAGTCARRRSVYDAFRPVVASP